MTKVMIEQSLVTFNVPIFSDYLNSILVFNLIDQDKYNNNSFMIPHEKYIVFLGK